MKGLRVMVSGMVAGDPGQGGATWAVLQYVLGLRRLGHDVLLVEPVREGSAAAARYFGDVCRDFELEGSAALLIAGTRRTVGVPYDELRRGAAGADVLINVSGMLRDAELAQPPPIRVYLDLDPAFNQLWHQVEGIDVGFAGHSHYATVGQSIGRDDCAVPTCGLDWLRTLPPVVLERWPVADGIAHDALTTVANWRAYGSIEVDGVRYGQKVHALRALYPLPRLSGEAFELGVAIHRDERSDLVALRENGWRLVDPKVAAGTPELYRRFVQGSRAEFGLAKEGYTVSRCGWFSDRSACYLASGRPVVGHETGLDGALPAGKGLLTFGSLDEAVERVAELASDYGRHALAARRLAEEYLDSDRVLTDLLQAVGAV